MHNGDGDDSALYNKNYSFSLFCMKNSIFCLKDVVVKIDFVDPKVLHMAMLQKAATEFSWAIKCQFRMQATTDQIFCT